MMVTRTGPQPSHSGTKHAPNTGQILRPSTPHQHDTMLLQIMSLSLNIRLYRLPVRQRDPCDFPLGRIWFLRLGDKNLIHHTLFEGIVLKKGSSGAFLDLGDSTADCLVEG